MNTTATKAAIIAVATVAGLGAASLAQAQGDDAPRVLEVRGFAGRIEVDTSVGGPLRASVTPGSTGLTATVAQRGPNLVVDGGADRRSINCDSRTSDDMRVRMNGRVYTREQLPVLRVTGGPGIGVRVVRSSVEGRIGNIAGATISTVGCGDLAIGSVRRDAEISIAGSGNIVLGDVGGDLELNIAGGGDTEVGAVSGEADLNIAGSGDVKLARSGTRVAVSIAGSGSVEVGAGESETEVSIAGSGDVRHKGVAVDPSVSIIGSGDVRLAAIRGNRSFSTMGSGNVTIGD